MIELPLSQQLYRGRTDRTDEWKMDEYVRMAQQLEAEIGRLRASIKRALADSESGTGWGPDVTVCAYLREALGEIVVDTV